jgi:folate-dependent phosphoribosylglycinamide formyltransferase PurN
MRVRVRRGDTPESLAARVLRVEHRAVVAALAALAAGEGRHATSATMADAPESVPPEAAAVRE